MFGINVNLKKAVAVSTIAIAGLMGAANASAQQYIAEEMEMARQERLKQERQEQVAEKADQKQNETAKKDEKQAEFKSSAYFGAIVDTII